MQARKHSAAAVAVQCQRALAAPAHPCAPHPPCVAHLALLAWLVLPVCAALDVRCAAFIEHVQGRPALAEVVLRRPWWSGVAHSCGLGFGAIELGSALLCRVVAAAAAAVLPTVLQSNAAPS